MKKKVITTADLAASIETVATSLATSTVSLTSSIADVSTSLDQLAISVKDGFDTMDQRFEGADHRLDQLEQGQEEIKLRLGNVAYRFELNDLGQRVERLERRAEFGSN